MALISLIFQDHFSLKMTTDKIVPSAQGLFIMMTNGSERI